MKKQITIKELDNKIQYIIDAGYNLQDYETSDMLGSFIQSLLDAQKQEIVLEIAQYSGIDDIQTKKLIKLIKGL